MSVEQLKMADLVSTEKWASHGAMPSDISIIDYEGNNSNARTSTCRLMEQCEVSFSCYKYYRRIQNAPSELNTPVPNTEYT